MAKSLNLNNKSKKVSFPDGRNSLDGIEFNKRVDPKWRKEFDELFKELEHAKWHTGHCFVQAQKCEVKYDKSTDSMQRAKWKQEMDFWHSKLCEARNELSQISKEFSEHQRGEIN